MPIFQSDLIIPSFLRAAIADIQRNKFLADDMMKETATDALLKGVYGVKEQERLKAFLKKKIHILVEHRQPDQAAYPCVVFSMGSGQEDTKQGLSNDYESEDVQISSLGGAITSNPRVIIEKITPSSYDPETGAIQFAAGVNLDRLGVYSGMLIYDTVNQKYHEINLVLDSSNLLIDGFPIDKAPNLDNMAIYPSKQIAINTIRSVKMWENHTLHLFATDATELIYLFNIVIYALIRYRKPLLDARNFGVSSFSYGELYRASNGEDPNHLYGRDVNIRGYVQQSAIESTSLPIDGVGLELDICATPTPEGILPQVDAQGWGMCPEECGPEDGSED